VVGGHALYRGTLRHRRFTPRPHAFTYDLFMACLDIDRIDDAMRVSPVAGVNRWSWMSFDDRDHLGDPSQPLRARLAASARADGHVLPDGPVLMLTHLRYLGYAFNPISFFYCYDEAGRLALVLNEVNSTFGEQRCYWIDARTAERTPNGLRHRTAKTMHVSPFMGMDVDYEFVLTEPGASLVAHMTTSHRGGGEQDPPYFDATLRLERRPWTAREVHAALFRHPFMTAKVIGAIHWEALKLWAKGLPTYARPGNPAAAAARSSKRATRTEIGG